MPPLISDEEISESEIPAKEPRAEPSKLEAEDYNDDDDEDDDDDDEGYEVEGIVGHKFKKGRLAFRIKWKGYDDPEDITTEPEDNLEAAQEILQEYLEAHGGRAGLLASKKSSAPTSSGKKRKLEDSPHAAVSNGRGRKGRAVATDGAGSRTNVDRRNGIYPPGSWEELVSNIDHIEETLDPKTGGLKRVAYIHWCDGDDPVHTRHDLTTLYKKCPQKMLVYYESHLVFRNTAAPGAQDELEGESAASFENDDGELED